MVIRHPRRLPLLALGMIALLIGMWAGLIRLGLNVPTLPPSLPSSHGPLMVSGFLGTLIALERAVALGRSWGYAAPTLAGLGGLSLIAGLPPVVGPALTAVGSLVFTAMFLVFVRLRPALYSATMGLGAILWLTGNVFWVLGWPIHQIVFWWIGFLLLTIAGERLELARLQQVSETSQAAFLTALGVLLAGLVVMTTALSAGVRVFGMGMLGLSLWLMRHDIALRTVRQQGLTRFIALCLLSGYIWLGFSGLLGLFSNGEGAGPYYDAILHAFFLGFAFAMIFGHAPIIFPAVLGSLVAFRPAFYAHLVLLHLTLILRLGGDLVLWLPGRQVGGLLNVLTLLLFLANTAYAILNPAGPARASSPVR